MFQARLYANYFAGHVVMSYTKAGNGAKHFVFHVLCNHLELWTSGTTQRCLIVVAGMVCRYIQSMFHNLAVPAVFSCECLLFKLVPQAAKDRQK